MGDIVLTSPVLRAIKSQLNGAEVHFLTHRHYESVVSHNPNIARVHFFENGLLSLIKTLREEEYDCVIDLHHNFRSGVVKLCLGVKSFAFDKLNFKKWIYVNFKINKLPVVHIVDRYFDAVKKIGVINDGKGLDFFIHERDEVPLDWLPGPFQKQFVAVVIGGKFFTKRLPVGKIIELCDRINKPVVLIGGKEDESVGKMVADFFERRLDLPETEELLKTQLGKKAEVFNGCGKFNIGQSASLVKQSLVVFTHDTGMMHIAAAFKKNIYSIWGNTSPLFGMYPYQTKFVIFENNKLSCRPCSKLGYEKCPKGHFKCMNDLLFDFYIP